MKLASARMQREAGFTLVEAIMVIVITGILAGIVAVFIARPVQGYNDTVRRAALADTLDVASRAMVREVRLALPNSLSVTTALSGGATWYFMEFIPTVTGGRYRDYGDGSSAGNFLDFSNASAKTFDILGPTLDTAVVVGDYVVVYNLGQGYAPADAYQFGTANTNIAPISALDRTNNTITLATNVFAAQSPPLPSPNGRFQIVSSNVRAVTYACPFTVPGNLVKYWNYGFTHARTTTPAVVAQNITCTFDYQPLAQRIGLLSIQLTTKDTTSNEQATLFQQVHVDNSP